MRYYSSTASTSAIANTAGLTPSEVQLVLSTTNGFPTQFPFTLRFSHSTPSEELVEVVSGHGTDNDPYIVIRGIDGTTAKSQPSGAVVVHSFSARDLQEPQQFMSDYGSMQRKLILRPTSDTTPIASTAYIADPYLQFYAEANKTYRLESTVGFDATPQANQAIKSKWSVPAGSTGARYVWGHRDQNLTTDLFNVLYAVDQEVWAHIPVAPGDRMSVVRDTVILKTASTPGDVIYNWGALVVPVAVMTIQPFAIFTYEEILG